MESLQNLRFGNFVIDRSRQALWTGERAASLRPQSFDVLCYLAERPGTVVSRDQLIEAVWHRRPASDESVTQCVKDIRQALGEDAQDIIKTVAKRGYLFAAEIAPVPVTRETALDLPDKAKSARRMTRAFPLARAGLTVATALFVVLAAALAVLRDQPSNDVAPMTLLAAPSVTVLPFAQTGGRPNQAASLGSVAADIATELATIGRSYAIQVKAVEGRDVDTGPAALRRLGTRYVVLGSQDKNQLSVRLLEAASNRVVWGQIFDRPALGSDAPELIATRIAHLISFQLLTAESQRPLPSVLNADGYALLGRARLLGERGAKANREARSLFEKGLALDPDSAVALVGTARTIVDDVLNGWAPPAERSALLDRAEAMNRRFIELQPRNREGHLQRGVLARARKNVEQAITAFEHTLELSPRYPQAHAELGRALIDEGLTAEAIAHIRDAFQLSPTDNAVYVWCFWAGMAAVYDGDYDVALGWLRKSQQANKAYDLTLLWLAVAHAGLGETEKAQAFLADYLALHPTFTLARWDNGPPYRNQTVAQQRRRLTELVRSLEVKQDEDEAHSSLRK